MRHIAEIIRIFLEQQGFAPLPNELILEKRIQIALSSEFIANFKTLEEFSDWYNGKVRDEFYARLKTYRLDKAGDALVYNHRCNFPRYHSPLTGDIVKP